MTRKAKVPTLWSYCALGEMSGPESGWTDSAQFQFCPDSGTFRALECGKGLWTRKLGRGLKRERPPPTALPGSQPRPLAPPFCTHPPLGERKSVSSSSLAPNIAPPFAPLRGGSRRVSRDFQRRRRKMPWRRAAFRQDELSHGYWAGRRLGSGEGGAKANKRTWRARPDERRKFLQPSEAVRTAGAPKLWAAIGQRVRGRGRGGNRRFGGGLGHVARVRSGGASEESWRCGGLRT